MALGEPDRTPLEIWMDRFWRGVYVLFVTLAYLAVFGWVMVPNRPLGLAMVIFVPVLYWRLVSYLVTGTQFELRVTTLPKDTPEMFSVIFTVLWAINMVVFVYHLVTWYDMVPRG